MIQIFVNKFVKHSKMIWKIFGKQLQLICLQNKAWPPAFILDICKVFVLNLQNICDIYLI